MVPLSIPESGKYKYLVHVLGSWKGSSPRYTRKELQVTLWPVNIYFGKVQEAKDWQKLPFPFLQHR